MITIETTLSNKSRITIVVEKIIAVSQGSTKTYVWTGGGEDDCFTVEDSYETILMKISTAHEAAAKRLRKEVSSSQELSEKTT